MQQPWVAAGSQSLPIRWRLRVAVGLWMERKMTEPPLVGETAGPRCPFCAAEGRPHWPRTYFYACVACGLIFRWPVPRDEELSRLYGEVWSDPCGEVWSDSRSSGRDKTGISKTGASGM